MPFIKKGWDLSLLYCVYTCELMLKILFTVCSKPEPEQAESGTFNVSFQYGMTDAYFS